MFKGAEPTNSAPPPDTLEKEYHTVVYPGTSDLSVQTDTTVPIYIIIVDGHPHPKAFFSEGEAQACVERLVSSFIDKHTYKMANGRSTFIYAGSKLTHKIVYFALELSQHMSD